MSRVDETIISEYTSINIFQLTGGGGMYELRIVYTVTQQQLLHETRNCNLSPFPLLLFTPSLSMSTIRNLSVSSPWAQIRCRKKSWVSFAFAFALHVSDAACRQELVAR